VLQLEVLLKDAVIVAVTPLPTGVCAGKVIQHVVLVPEQKPAVPPHPENVYPAAGVATKVSVAVVRPFAIVYVARQVPPAKPQLVIDPEAALAPVVAETEPLLGAVTVIAAVAALALSTGETILISENATKNESNFLFFIVLSMALAYFTLRENAYLLFLAVQRRASPHDVRVATKDAFPFFIAINFQTIVPQPIPGS
jgi:hypothetical protein